ncbi:MAG TPA: hypothetical protein EYP14_11110, partial [Planctomycetaceae bacterium]|nr:hypothetical protein [Planctomycetaceae bacterium]
MAYLWARTVTCKNCRATVPLLKTRWLCKRTNKRVLLTLEVVEAASSPLHPGCKSTRRDVASTETYAFFDPTEPVVNLKGNLPHWRQEHVTYFVTFRLADSVPQHKLRLWRRERDEWLRSHPQPHSAATRRQYLRRFTARLERWLDAGYGECLLQRPQVRAIVEQALRHSDGERYYLDEFVVMPNHVHVLVTPRPGHSLSKIVQSWKSFTAHVINNLLGRRGALWQKEYFDHIVRNPD